MTLTDRDRKIVSILVPLLILAAYFFFVLSPKREESKKVAEQLTEAQGRRDTAQAQVGQLNAAKRSFAGDYATVIYMGKAVPESVDMASLLVQLDRAARGTGVNIQGLKVAPPSSQGGTAPTGTPPGGGGNPGAGGSGAQSPMGKSAQNAGNQVNNANAKSQQSANQGNQQGGQGGGAPGAQPGGSPTQATPGLSSVGLTFQLRGKFFEMADFFHRMKRFVLVVDDKIVIRGRLIVVDTWNFQSDAQGIKAEVQASVYLSPKAQGGVSAGASPGGPSPTPGGGQGGVASDPASQSPSPSTPTATATP